MIRTNRPSHDGISNSSYYTLMKELECEVRLVSVAGCKSDDVHEEQVSLSTLLSCIVLTEQTGPNFCQRAVRARGEV